MSFHGGLLGCLVGVWTVARLKRLPLAPLADRLVIPALVGIIAGRLANFMNGELVGTVTTVPWCVVIEGVTGCRHPSPLYEAAYTLAILAAVLALLAWQRRGVATRDGTVIGVFLVLYGTLRTVANVWRDDPRWFLGLGTGQWLSVLTALVGVALLVHVYRKRDKPRAARRRP
jgi:phosphatidylglycerol:prolipoprotein diacylglycerol transferase